MKMGDSYCYLNQEDLSLVPLRVRGVDRLAPDFLGPVPVEAGLLGAAIAGSTVPEEARVDTGAATTGSAFFTGFFDGTFLASPLSMA